MAGWTSTPTCSTRRPAPSARRSRWLTSRDPVTIPFPARPQPRRERGNSRIFADRIAPSVGSLTYTGGSGDDQIHFGTGFGPKTFLPPGVVTGSLTLLNYP